MNDKILVLAPVAKEGGALSILIDCLTDLSNTSFTYTVVVHPIVYDVLPLFSNISYKKLSISSWLERIKYDNFGYPGINYSDYRACINFQNIPVRTNITQIIYYHQSLPLTDIYFSPFNKKTYKLFLYKHFYGYFFLWNKKYASKIIVQSDWVKKELSIKFRFEHSNIAVIPPRLNHVDISVIPENNTTNGYNVLFYPAADFDYKNHKVIVEALNFLGLEYLRKKRIKVIFTVNSLVGSELFELITLYGLNDFFVFAGNISREEVYSILKGSNALVFPSKLETYGLPLKEATQFGINILASDMPYAREVLRGYRYKKFCMVDDFKEWGTAICESVDDRLDSIDDSKELVFHDKFSDFIYNVLKGL